MKLSWTKKLHRLTGLSVALLATMLVVSSAASAAGPIKTPSQKCKQKRTIAAGSYNKCLMEALKRQLGVRGKCSISEENCTSTVQCAAGESCDKSTVKFDLLFSVCGALFQKKWDTSGERALVKGDPCAAEPTFEQTKLTVQTDAGALAIGIDTGAPPTVCGNDLLEPSEVCDFNQLDGETCQGLGYEGGFLACAENCLAFDTSGCFEAGDRYADQGNGTIYDKKTRLLWEKKDGTADIHGYTRTFAPCAGTPRVDGAGTAYTDLIAPMNAAVYGGCDEWRIPSLDEFYSLYLKDASRPHMPVEFNTGCPCLDVTSPLCSCSNFGEYHLNAVVGSENSTPTLNATYATIRQQNCGNGLPVRVVCGPMDLP